MIPTRDEAKRWYLSKGLNTFLKVYDYIAAYHDQPPHESKQEFLSRCFGLMFAELGKQLQDD